MAIDPMRAILSTLTVPAAAGLCACFSSSSGGPASVDFDAGAVDVAVGGDSEADASSDATVDSSVDSAMTDSGGDDSPQAGDSAAVDVGVDAPSTPQCAFYCGEVMANCTGANAQYPSMASCLAVCAALPVGTVDDTSGDTLGCRQHYGGAPAMGAPAVNCTNAGPTGGDLNVPDGGTGVCGSGCQAFCDIVTATCTNLNQQFADTPVCLADCATYATLRSPPYSIADTVTNDFGCRMYHLTLAASSPASATTECPHIVPNSSTCTQ
jgi:hypothetical protein